MSERFRKNLRWIMCDKGIGATELARMMYPGGSTSLIETTRKRITRYLTGHTAIRLHNVHEIAAALGIPDKDLVYATYEELRDRHGKIQTIKQNRSLKCL